MSWDTVVKIRASAKHLKKPLTAIQTTVDPDAVGQLPQEVNPSVDVD